MLSKLKRLIALYGMVKVTNDLGFRSVTTIRNWFDSGIIPIRHSERVKNYLKGVENESDKRQKK